MSIGLKNDWIPGIGGRFIEFDRCSFEALLWSESFELFLCFRVQSWRFSFEGSLMLLELPIQRFKK
tara:strand:- start:26 stop:223 length:198 start_codon:yes stop_codon:yes gene_type:complete